MNAAASEVWSAACRHLQNTLNPDVYVRWISGISAVEKTADALTLAVDNDFYQMWLEEHYLTVIKTAVASVTGQPCKIRFSVQENIAPKAAAPIETAEPRKTVRTRTGAQATATANLNPKFTFNDFIIGSSNNFAHASAMAVAQSPGHAYNPLFIYGGTGLGKTHLMEAIGHHVQTVNPKASVCYLTLEDFLNEYIDAIQNKNLMPFRRKYRHTDVLLIDDIHFLASKERLQEEFFHTFNALFHSHKQIVMTSDRPAAEIAGLEQRLVSRFEWGLVTEMEPPDLETRLAILRHKQAQMGSTLPPDVVSFIAENIRANIRRLEGALVRVISFASLTKQPPTVESVRSLLRDTLEQEKQKTLTYTDIQKMVAEHYDVRLSDMSSIRRNRAVAVPRHVAMYLCRRLTRASLPDIANVFGKTHATVLHACRLIETRMSVDQDLRSSVETLSTKLEHL